MPTDDPIDFDFTFADDGDLVRRAPKDRPEDPIEARLQREVYSAEFMAEAIARKTPGGADYVTPDGRLIDFKTTCVEVRHGSGKVRV